MMGRTLSAVCLVAVLCAGCKSSGGDPEAPKAVVETPDARAAGDFGLLVEEVQLLRDREFAKPPKIVAKADYAPPARCLDACRNEKLLLERVLFGGEVGAEPELAHFDRDSGEVRYDATAKGEPLEFAIATALVAGLDRQTGAPLPPPDTWDASMTRAAVANGAGVFVAALRKGRQVREGLTAEELARFPETLEALAPSSALDSFARREGFALAAAMYRAGGWSAVELLRNEPPHSSRSVVRPDLYLGGADVGRWEWPSATATAREAAGWTLSESGRVGPALFVKWLQRHTGVAARGAYLALESDAYRTWRDGDGWIWEWVSLWSTPDAAQQIVEALDAGLRTQPGARYSVLRKGLTVVVVGTNTDRAADLEIGSQLVDARVLFQPGDPRGLGFVPTPADRLINEGIEAAFTDGVWHDPVTGVSIDSSGLAAWKIQRTKDVRLRWFARHPDETIFEVATDVRSPLAAPFESEARLEQVREAFRKTVPGAQEIVARRVSAPREGTIELTLSKGGDGAATGSALHLWQFPSGDYVLTVSVQGAEGTLPERVAEVAPLIATIDVPTERPEPRPAGVIEFEVEE